MVAPHWLDDVEMRAWLALLRAHASLVAKLDRELLEEHGLSLGDYEVLAFLSEAPDDRLRMCDLAPFVRVSPSALTRRIDSLERAGLVARERCDADARVVFAVLTTAGRRLLEAVAPTHVRGVREHLIDRLDRRQLAAIAKALEPIGRDCPAGDL